MDPAEFGISADDWRVLTRTRPNALLIGSDDHTTRILQALAPMLKPPVAHCSSRAFLLPADAAGTFIVRNIGDLAIEHQDQLLAWLQKDVRSALQIITTTPLSLMPRVDQGLFRATLYYRLNVLCLFVGV